MNPQPLPLWLILAVCSGGVACSASQPLPLQVPADLVCKLHALDALTADPEDITARNIENVVKAVQGCELIQRDAGSGLE